MTAEWRQLKIEEIEWTYKVMGKGSESLIIFPGGMRRPLEESQFIDKLAEKYLVLSPVYPRIGSLKKLSDGMVAILNYEKIQRAHIYGSSFGGVMAQAFAVYHSDRILKIIIGNTGTRMNNDEWINKMQKALQIIRSLPAFLARKIVLRTFIRVVPADFEGREKIAATIRDLIKSRKLDKEDMICHFESLIDFHQNVNLNSETAAVFADRLLIITATGDKGVSPDSITALHAMYPNAQYYHFDEGGHMPMLVFPDRYLKVLENFLSN